MEKITKREHFAAIALQGLLAGRFKPYVWDKQYNIKGNMKFWDEQLKDQVKLCVRYADYLIDELNTDKTSKS